MMDGDRLPLLVPGQAVPFWPRGWIKLLWVPAVLIVVMTMSASASAAWCSKPSPVALRQRGGASSMREGQQHGAAAIGRCHSQDDVSRLMGSN
jgi:hypothetical protein